MGVSSGCITPRQHFSVVLQYSNREIHAEKEPLACDCPLDSNILKTPVFRDSPKEGETKISAGEVCPQHQRSSFNTYKQSVLPTSLCWLGLMCLEIVQLFSWLWHWRCAGSWTRCATGRVTLGLLGAGCSEDSRGEQCLMQPVPYLIK